MIRTIYIYNTIMVIWTWHSRLNYLLELLFLRGTIILGLLDDSGVLTKNCVKVLSRHLDEIKIMKEFLDMTRLKNSMIIFYFCRIYIYKIDFHN